MTTTDFGFLKATRFWAMVLGALSIYLQGKGWIGAPEMVLIATLTAGFIAVRTADRFGEQKVLAAAVQAGQIPVSAVRRP